MKQIITFQHMKSSSGFSVQTINNFTIVSNFEMHTHTCALKLKVPRSILKYLIKATLTSLSQWCIGGPFIKIKSSEK